MLVDDWFNLLFQPMLDTFGRLVEWCWSMVGSIFSSNQCWIRLDTLLDDVGRWLVQSSLPTNVGYVWTPCWTLVDDWFKLLFQPMLDTFGHLVEWCWSMIGSIFSSNQYWLPLYTLLDVGRWLVQYSLPTNIGYVWTPCWMMLVDGWFNLFFQPMLDTFGHLVGWSRNLFNSVLPLLLAGWRIDIFPVAKNYQCSVIPSCFKKTNKETGILFSEICSGKAAMLRQALKPAFQRYFVHVGIL